MSDWNENNFTRFVSWFCLWISNILQTLRLFCAGGEGWPIRSCFARPIRSCFDTSSITKVCILYGCVCVHPRSIQKVGQQKQHRCSENNSMGMICQFQLCNQQESSSNSFSIVRNQYLQFSVTRWHSWIFHERNERCHRVFVYCFQADLSTTMMSDWNENTFIRFVSLFYLRISLVLIFNSFLLSRKVQMGGVNGNSRTETKPLKVPNSHHQNKETKQPTDQTSNAINAMKTTLLEQ